jgi:predicted porin
LVFAAKEDLGGGVTATADMAFVSRGRDTAKSGRDAKIVVAGGFGSILVGAIEAGNGIIGLGGAGAPVYGLDDNTVLQAASNTDMIRYTTPTMSGFNVYISSLDVTTAGGLQSTATTQDATQIGINYAAGPLRVAADMTNYGTNSATGTLADSRLRMSASYNLGVANVGFGYQDAETTTGVSKTEQLFGVAVPMGAITLGMNYATSKTDGVAGTNKGTDLGAKYDLSKRTYVAAHYQTTKAAGAANSASKYRVQLAHSF